MVKQSKLELDGVIVEVLPAGKFRVRLEEMDTVIMCYKSGKMKMSHISVIEGDKVKVEVSPYDVSQGRIVYRYNLNKPHPTEAGHGHSASDSKGRLSSSARPTA